MPDDNWKTASGTRVPLDAGTVKCKRDDGGFLWYLLQLQDSALAIEAGTGFQEGGAPFQWQDSAAEVYVASGTPVRKLDSGELQIWVAYNPSRGTGR